MNTSEIESLLRQAPKPRPPEGLRDQLRSKALSADVRAGTGFVLPASGRRSWLARWWPALAPGAASLACAAVLTVQHFDIQELQTKLQSLPQEPAPAEQPTPATPGSATEAVIAGTPAAGEAEEVERLKVLVGKLTADVAQLEQMRTENERLRQQAAAPAANVLSAEETKVLEEARDKASKIQCINNLKQLGLAARIWATDNADTSPPNLLSMTNELGTPKILVCPADSGRQAAADWASFSAANCSYEYLAPSAPETESDRVMFRCPIHGNIGLCDGSVQGEIAKTHPDWLVQRDGKLYFRANAEVQYTK